jgi:hypothetical protein
MVTCRMSKLARARRDLPRVGGDRADFHNAPRRQYVVNLTGSVELVVGDGTKRRSVGRRPARGGHDRPRSQSLAVRGEPRTCLFIPLGDQGLDARRARQGVCRSCCAGM